MTDQNKFNIFCWRLKQARQASGISQKTLGISLGLDEFTAGPRINRYEKGVHNPDPIMAGRIAAVLDVPLAFLYAETDYLAKIILSTQNTKSEKLLDLIDLNPIQ
jgi:transcriptional regulator with XRE-family HTH domain